MMIWRIIPDSDFKAFVFFVIIAFIIGVVSHIFG